MSAATRSSRNATASARLKRSSTGLLLTGALVTPLALIGAPAANAYEYATSGTPGPYTTSAVQCVSKRWGNTHNLVMTAQPPQVWARNSLEGYGNDASLVRYTAWVADQNTGAMVELLGTSDWTYATDQNPAAFPGQIITGQPNRGNYSLEYIIEWHSGTEKTAHVGWHHTTYKYTSVYGLTDTYNSCIDGKLTPYY